jgi:hypothetical protein
MEKKSMLKFIKVQKLNYMSFTSFFLIILWNHVIQFYNIYVENKSKIKLYIVYTRFKLFYFKLHIIWTHIVFQLIYF